MIRKIFFSFFIYFLFPNITLSQVGINTVNVDPDAILEVLSNERGILLPRVALTQTTNFSPLTAHVAGMLVYNNNTINDVTPGFYYNDGTQWNRINTLNYGVWSLTGNNDIDSNTNFVGTTDNVALALRTNSNVRARLETNGTFSLINPRNSTFVGEGAGINENIDPKQNTYVGTNSGGSNTLGVRSTAIGSQSYSNNTTGTNNNAIGSNALRNITNGEHNVAIGAYSAFTNNGDRNVSIGSESLYSVTNGLRNTSLGYQSMQNNSTGNDNTAVGKFTLNGVTGESFSTAIGYNAFNTGNFRNSTAIGYNTVINDNNIIHLGNASITNISGQVNFTTYSDRRIKEKISEDVAGISFIKKLRPVTYNFNVDKQNKFLKISDDLNFEEKYDIEKIKFSGFIAQEVEKASIESNYEFSGIKKPKNEGDLFQVSYTEFVVPLVKTIQEQQIRIAKLKSEIITLLQ